MRLPFLTVIFVTCALAQAPSPGSTVRSPEIHADGKVTFRLYAPKATEVSMRGEWMPGTDRAPLVKDESGVWSVTLGPLRADLYGYSLQVDGVTIIDPRNPAVKLGATSSTTSLVDIPGEAAAFHTVRNVPHGTVHIHYYMSKATGSMRRVHVYTPPGYEMDAKAKYPVLYLLHGSGDTDAE
ncbi:MAG: hypothetical protein JJE04_19795 [Acidobacteriia bacterium]|nr:hypothetical protein [Terriglobia bacterium]